MIQNRKVLALIPARGGSKGLPGKNIRPLCGKPLLGWSVEAALKSRYIDRVVVSSDDRGILDAARAAGADVPFVRPASLATDDASAIDVALHALEQMPGYDYLALLQPTSPLRTTADIDQGIERCVAGPLPQCVSVTELGKSPAWLYLMDPAGRLKPLLPPSPSNDRRQTAVRGYFLNGAVYVSEVAYLRETRAFVTESTAAYVMSEERSMDIDTIEDFRRAEAALERQAGRK